MSYIKRDIEKTILEVSQSYSAVLLTGPRQVGKTTTLRRIADENRRHVTLDDMESRRMARSDPELFLDINPAPLLIDEVQYAPELFSYIKIAIDNGARPGSFWMTGSQAFRLMELAQESLAGRAAILKMSSLSQHEIYGNGGHPPFEPSFDNVKTRAKNAAQTDTKGQYERVWRGSMPSFVSGKYPNREVFYSSYVNSYIERDIGDMMSKVDALQFADFIRAAACRAGQMLNTHDIALDIGVTDDTARRWLQMLEKSGVIFFLRPYSNNLLKRTVKMPKMYFFDTGLVAYLTKYGSSEILMNGAINGAILENYVVAEIIKSYTNNGAECFVHYYRDKDNKEVDLILESGGELHPLEIKKTASPAPELVRTFAVLDKGSVPRGNGAIICTKPEFSAIDRQTAIVPVWTV
ncbi:MAG: ATP-binding protein [Clostridiales Family XIII bacterium]|jgi:predicted AAA+ superfamily ATPase|nr:ATP-binding protein [Clostridiales Family XIII bacterium]